MLVINVFISDKIDYTYYYKSDDEYLIKYNIEVAASQ